jgi:hypothetical protein
VKPGEATGPQAKSGGMAGYSSVELPGFSSPPDGTYDTYRLISAHPTVALAMSIVTSPVATAGLRWRKSDQSVPDERLAAVEGAFGPLRHDGVRDCLLALRFGWSPFEVVWGRDGRLVVPTRLKPLMPDLTAPLLDGNGNVRGLRNKGRSTIDAEGDPRGAVDLIGPKAFWWTYDAQWGDPHGRSRFENIRTTWAQALQLADRLAQYYRKVAGVIVQLHYPDGTSKDASGADRPNDQIAKDILDAVSRGQSVRFQNKFASLVDQDPIAAMKTAGMTDWVLSALKVDAGDHAAGLLKGLEAIDRAIFAGLLRSARTGLESAHGSRADSQQHTDTGTQDAQLVADDICRAWNRGPVDDMLAANWGDAARGSVYAEVEPIESNRQQVLATLLQAMFSNPSIAPDLAQRLDRRRILEEMDLPVLATAPDADGVPEGGRLLPGPTPAGPASPGSTTENDAGPQALSRAGSTWRARRAAWVDER